jgi:hypothetical protein
MSFLRTRNRLMIQRGWNRRVATLAARLSLGVDTWEGIEATPSFRGLPLLTGTEVMYILKAFGIRAAETWHVEPSETEGVAPPVNGAGGGVHPTFNVVGTQTGRWSR